MLATKNHESSKSDSSAPPDRAKGKDTQSQQTEVNPVWSRIATGVQTKLTIGAPKDIDKQGAGSVADRLIRRIASADVETTDSHSLGNSEPQRKCQASSRHDNTGHAASGNPTQPSTMAVTISPTPLLVQRKCASCATEGQLCSGCKAEDSTVIQRAAKTGAKPQSATGRVVPQSGGGQTLERGTKRFMEGRFGRDFSRVRVHADSQAAHASSTLNAHAFTVGQHIYFGANRYNPGTQEGRHLLAHELTHTVQQGTASQAARNDDNSLRLSRPDDLFEREAERVAHEVLEGGASRVDVSSTGSAMVQRFELPELPSLDEAVEGARGAVESALEAGEEAVDWAGEKATEARDWAAEKVDDAGEAVSEAASWLTTTAGKAALSTANGLASLFGGSVVIRRGCLVITIPEITAFPSFQKTLGETPPIGFFVPLVQGGTMIGPFPLVGMAGFLVYGQGSLEAAVGPGVIRGIRFELCPFASTASATAQFYAAAAIAPRIQLFGGLFAALGTAIPTTPPTSIIVIAQGGLRATGTGWLIGAVQDTLTITYAGGTLSATNVTDLMGGVLLQGDVDLYAALRLNEKVICDYAHPLGHWETGAAWKLTIPIHGSLGKGGRSGSIGPITFGPMPIKDIETAIRPLPTGWNCLSWAEIKQILCDDGILPPEMCEVEDAEEGDDEPGALKKFVTASGRCKCVGDDDCGGGKIYKVCYETQKDCKKAQKDLDDFCNNNSEMKKKCIRPKCYYRHNDPNKCPDDCDPGTITPLEDTPQTVTCPSQKVTMGGARCGRTYGAVGTYCYDGAQNWWFKENVKNGAGPHCQPGNINQTTRPFQSASGCVSDRIFNHNGPPGNVAPCDDITNQIVFAGPTRADVEKCQYKNEQVITVTETPGSSPISGKVITSSAGVATDCDWP